MRVCPVVFAHRGAQLRLQRRVRRQQALQMRLAVSQADLDRRAALPADHRVGHDGDLGGVVSDVQNDAGRGVQGEERGERSGQEGEGGHVERLECELRIQRLVGER